MIIRIKLTPNSKKEEINLKENIYHIHIKEQAEDNKANIALINLVAKYFKVPAKDIKIKSGLKNRKKIVEIKEENKP